MKQKLHLLFVITLFVITAHAQTFNETFDSDPTGGSPITSFVRTLAGESFTFSFTSDGDAGDFVWENGYGEGGSAAINAQSTIPNTGTTERITITKTNLSDFTFNSIFINNGAGSTLVVAGYNDGGMVGSSQSVSTGISTTLTFNNIIIDEVRITSTDFYQLDIDSFSGSTATLGLGEVALESDKQIFPNPTSNIFSISGLESSKEYKVINMIGELVLNGIIKPNEEINVQNLTNGLYFVLLDNKNTLKLIKN